MGPVRYGPGDAGTRPCQAGRRHRVFPRPWENGELPAVNVHHEHQCKASPAFTSKHGPSRRHLSGYPGGVPVETAAGLCVGCSGNHWQVLGLMWSSVCYQPPGKWPLPLPTLHCASLYVLASRFRIQRRLGVTLNVRHPWLPHSSQPGPSVSLCSCRISVPSRS